MWRSTGHRPKVRRAVPANGACPLFSRLRPAAGVIIIYIYCGKSSFVILSAVKNPAGLAIRPTFFAALRMTGPANMAFRNRKQFTLWQRFPKHWRLRSSTIKPAGCKLPSRSIGRFLQAEPNHADAIHLLGVVAYQVGKHEIAVEYIGRAIGLKGNAAAFHNNLGEAYRALGKFPEAVACCRRALELKPDYAEAHNNLGNALKEQGKLDEAVACYRRALELKPDYAEAHNNLGIALQGPGKLDEAVACYRRAVELKPDYAEAHNNLGVPCRTRGNWTKRSPVTAGHWN